MRCASAPGRLLQAFVARFGELLACAVARSDDHGRTWVMSPPIGPDGNEGALFEAPDGRVALLSRRVGARRIAWSTDGGITFSRLEPVDELPEAGNNGGAGADWSRGSLYVSRTAGPDLRARLLLSRSTDAGRTWPDAVVLTEGGAGYSVCHVLPDGRIGVLFEDAGCRRLIYMTVGPGDFRPSPATDRSPIAMVLEHIVPTRERDWLEPGTVRSCAKPVPATGTPAVFKIVTDPHGQIVHSRACYRSTLPPPVDRLRAGDILRLGLRIRSDRSPTLVVVDGHRWTGALLPVRDLDDGRRWVARSIPRLVTDRDVALGVVEVMVEVFGAGFTERTALAIPVNQA